MFIQKSCLTTDFSFYISPYLIIHMYNPAVSTDSVMEHIAPRVYHHKYYQKLTRLFEGDLCFIYWAFSALDRVEKGQESRADIQQRPMGRIRTWVGRSQPYGMWSPAQRIELNQCPRCPVFYAVCITTVTGSCLEALLSH